MVPIQFRTTVDPLYCSFDVNKYGEFQKFSLKDYVEKFINNYREERQDLFGSAEEYLEKIQKFNLKKIMKMGYMVYLIISILPSLKTESSKINQYDIFMEYSKEFEQRQLAKMSKTEH